jgi:hypothetical protein
MKRGLVCILSASRFSESLWHVSRPFKMPHDWNHAPRVPNRAVCLDLIVILLGDTRLHFGNNATFTAPADIDEMLS